MADCLIFGSKCNFWIKQKRTEKSYNDEFACAWGFYLGWLKTPKKWWIVIRLVTIKCFSLIFWRCKGVGVEIYQGVFNIEYVKYSTQIISRKMVIIGRTSQKKWWVCWVVYLLCFLLNGYSSFAEMKVVTVEC